jgi:hypothetical protein
MNIFFINQVMPCALIVNNNIQFQKISSLNNFSIFKMIIFEFLKYNNQFYIVGKKQFYNKIIDELNNINFLINNDVHLLIYESDLDNYQITFLLTNLIFSEFTLIPLNDYNFDLQIRNIKKINLKIKKKIYWTHPVYLIKSNNFKSQFLIKKKYKFCLIEFFIKHEKKIFNLFFNKITNTYQNNKINNNLINNIKKYPNYNLIIYHFK